ncbi:hypothetical protein [Halobacteriovorax sp. HLS]|uniref:hypothetical protein n=1 Tax=Halobacteriovorax sp. HLS TaxID=2234000 RepID=UPI000FD6FFB3|nr:hypothetical protein [Halobacteriovorax sp. HLS]
MKIFLKMLYFNILVFLVKHSKTARDKTYEALKQIKHVLSTESKESVQMVEIYNKALKRKATSQELKWANDQLQDIFKTLGLGAFLILPFAPITLPLLIKLSKYFGIQLTPSSMSKSKDEQSDKI